ncbi:hypothetical protein [Halobacillus naozhouensis]|uniref:Uncharacterized protein n=1 Tax=Halobacillus naozhouensis TaxID=554880 RepID=A0ABY8J1F5_9BACI|nr:hypothetical protein [Halobacillus naozhouensis]WFT76320.1 hypothetical protein P9989_08150 [Halobacillus naozhouensis]
MTYVPFLFQSLEHYNNRDGTEQLKKSYNMITLLLQNNHPLHGQEGLANYAANWLSQGEVQ